jgi:hypothetical protein
MNSSIRPIIQNSLFGFVSLKSDKVGPLCCLRSVIETIGFELEAIG